jgi:hypothetical protein
LKETERTKVVATEAGRKGDDSLEGEEAREGVKGELRTLERFKTCVDIRRYAAVLPWKEGALRATFVEALGKSTCRLNEVMLWCVVYERQESESLIRGQTRRPRFRCWPNAFEAQKRPAKTPISAASPPSAAGHATSKEFDLGQPSRTSPRCRQSHTRHEPLPTTGQAGHSPFINHTHTIRPRHLFNTIARRTHHI